MNALGLRRRFHFEGRRYVERQVVRLFIWVRKVNRIDALLGLERRGLRRCEEIRQHERPVARHRTHSRGFERPLDAQRLFHVIPVADARNFERNSTRQPALDRVFEVLFAAGFVFLVVQTAHLAALFAREIHLDLSFHGAICADVQIGVAQQRCLRGFGPGRLRELRAIFHHSLAARLCLVPREHADAKDFA